MLHAQEILNLKKRLNEIYVKHTGQPLKKIEDALERDYFLTAEVAKDFGIDRQGDREAAGGTAAQAADPDPGAAIRPCRRKARNGRFVAVEAGYR